MLIPCIKPIASKILVEMIPRQYKVPWRSLEIIFGEKNCKTNPETSMELYTRQKPCSQLHICLNIATSAWCAAMDCQLQLVQVSVMLSGAQENNAAAPQASKEAMAMSIESDRPLKTGGCVHPLFSEVHAPFCDFHIDSLLFPVGCHRTENCPEHRHHGHLASRGAKIFP